MFSLKLRGNLHSTLSHEIDPQTPLLPFQVSYEQLHNKGRKKSETESENEAANEDEMAEEEKVEGRQKSPAKRLMSVEETNLQTLVKNLFLEPFLVA